MSGKRFALIEWEDRYISIISADTICHPRKEVSEYEEGEYIKAKFRGSIYKAVIAELSGDKKHLEEKKKKGELKHTFQDSLTGDKKHLEEKKKKGELEHTFQDSLTGDKKHLEEKKKKGELEHTSQDSLTASCSSKPLTNVRLTPKKRAPATSDLDSDSSTLAMQMPSARREMTTPARKEMDNSDTCTNSDTDFDHEFLIKKSSGKNRDKRKIEQLSKDVEELRTQVKKLRKRIRTLEKTGENKMDTSKDQSDEFLEIPHGQQISVSALTSSVRRCITAPEAISLLLKSLFSLTEIKNCSISGKKTIKCAEGGPRPPLDPIRFRVLERVLTENFPAVTRKEVREKIQNIQKVERKRY